MDCRHCQQPVTVPHMICIDIAGGAQGRLCTQVHIGCFCSDACRDAWWSTPTTDDLIALVPNASMPCLDCAGTANDAATDCAWCGGLGRVRPRGIHSGDQAVVVFRQHNIGGAYVDVEGYAFESAVDINPWWKVEPTQDMTLARRGYRCRRGRQSFEFLESIPKHWVKA